MTELDDGTMGCPNECEEDCELCGSVVGDCHEDGSCANA